MVRNLIRNGGFELGNTSYWKGTHGSTFDVITNPVYKGTYAGRIVAQTGPSPTITPTDFIELGLDETAALEMYLRASDVIGIHIWLYHYDEELNQVNSFRVEPFNTVSGAWLQKLYEFSGREGAKYVKPLIYFNATVIGQELYLDGVSMYKTNAETAMVRSLEIMRRTDLGSVGTYYSNLFYVAPFTQGEFVLHVDTCTGTSETVDVTIESQGAYDEIPRTIATFNQVTTGGDLQMLVVTAGLGAVLRAKVVVGGSPIIIEARITAVFKR